MTRIKCRYTIPYCTYFGIGQHKRIYHDEFWFCEDGTNCPEECEYRGPDNADNMFDLECVYCKYVNGEFEKNVKNYEYHDGELTIGRSIYTEFEIEYLEIDGRILVDEFQGVE